MKLYNKKKDNCPTAVYIGRPSKWGNPFIVGIHGSRKQCVQYHKEWLAGIRSAPNMEPPPSTVEIQKELRNKDLMCWCFPKECHGEILLKIANKEENE